MTMTNEDVIAICAAKLLERVPRELQIPSCESSPQATDFTKNLLRLPLALMALAGLRVYNLGGDELPNHAETHATAGDDPITPASIGAVADDDPRLSDDRDPTAHAHVPTDITGSSALGRALLVALTSLDARTIIGARGPAQSGVASFIAVSSSTPTQVASYEVPASAVAVHGSVDFAIGGRLTNNSAAAKDVRIVVEVDGNVVIDGTLSIAESSHSRGFQITGRMSRTPSSTVYGSLFAIVSGAAASAEGVGSLIAGTVHGPITTEDSQPTITWTAPVVITVKMAFPTTDAELSATITSVEFVR